jgi:predicted ABC-type ATPase
LHQPYLYIIAGPNGAGKSTAISFFKTNEYIDFDIPYLNPDVISLQLKQQHPDISNFEIDQIASDRRNELIRSGQSLIIESNLATEASYALMDGVRRRNFKVVLFFICLLAPELCIWRVHDRVLKGGHDVPEEIIIHRYKNSINLLRSKIIDFDNGYLFDNSGQTIRLIASTESRRILWQTETMPEWGIQVLITISLFNK